MSINDEVRREIADGREVFTPLVTILKGEPADQTLDEARRAYIDVKARQQSPDGVRFEPVDMGGVPALLATSSAATRDRTLLYIHGGGYVSGGPGASKAEVGRLAEAIGARAYVPDYRLAPEHLHPAPLDDVLVAYPWLLDQGTAPGSIVLAGESAGGAIVVSAMVRARDAGLPLPAAGLAISPWANLEHSGASMTDRDGVDPVVTKAALDLLADAFLGDASRNDPEASPVFADVSRLPPVMIQVGETEVMMSDAIRLAEHLATSGVRTTLEVWPGMFHVWHHFAAILPEGRQAITTGAAFLKAAFRIVE